jgi:hypothetical protein
VTSHGILNCTERLRREKERGDATDASNEPKQVDEDGNRLASWRMQKLKLRNSTYYCNIRDWSPKRGYRER